MRLESQIVEVEGKIYLVYFRYWPAQREEIEIETVYELLDYDSPELDQKIKKVLLTMKQENEDAASSQSEE